VRYDYPGGVLPEERGVIERFETEVMPFVEKNGGRLGEAAMQGNLDAEQAIMKYHHFINGMPHLREVNLKALISALKRWEVRSMQ